VTQSNEGSSASEVPPINRSNWLRTPFNRTAFRRVREFLPVVDIDSDPDTVIPFETRLVEPAGMTVRGAGGEEWALSRFLNETFTDAFLVLHDGQIIVEWYGAGRSPSDEHIVFSVTKSLVGSLVGVLVDLGKLEPLAPVVTYVPEVRGSGYREARVRDLLDMTVGLEFAETPLVANSPFARYREAVGWEDVTESQTAAGIHAFLETIEANGDPHGSRFSYLSPNSDLLGWVCERAAGSPLAELISRFVWKPIGAGSRGSITVDHLGTPRAAGGFSCTLRDMARFGECMRNVGKVAGRQVIPQSWIQDILTNGDRGAWERGAIADWIPNGCYRSQWWVTNNEQGALFAAGLYSHWIYISPLTGVVIAKQSSPPVGPADKSRFCLELGAFASLARTVSSGGVLFR
jgi:CubicO group peptidase (beta-lactamase class C family)